MLGAFCLTEPHVGSEAGGPADERVRDDGADYVLNGVKQFITSGKNGDLAIVMAVTDKAAGKKASAPSSSRPPTPATRRAARGQSSASTPATPRRSCSRTVASCRRENLLGDEGQGLRSRSPASRAGGSASARQAIGMARGRRSEAALAYCQGAGRSGEPIFEHQALQFRARQRWRRIEVARQMVHHAARH